MDNTAEHLIPHAVAKQIIHQLKVINVYINDGNRMGISADTVDLHLQQFVEVTCVDRTRNKICTGSTPFLSPCLLQFCYQVGDGDKKPSVDECIPKIYA